MLTASVNLYIADVKRGEGTDLALVGKELRGINLRNVNLSLEYLSKTLNSTLLEKYSSSFFWS